MSFNKKLIPERVKCSFGYAREQSSRLALRQNIPIIISYLIAFYCCIGVAFQIGNAPDGCIDIDRDRCLLARLYDCDILTHNHTIYTETLARSDEPAIYIWKFIITDMTFDLDVTFGLVPDKSNVDFGSFNATKSLGENVHLISKWKGAQPTTEELGNLQTDDIICFIYNSKNKTLSYIINDGKPTVFFQNIYSNKSFNYKFGVYLHNNFTSIKYIPHDILTPNPMNATFNSAVKFNYDKCFECNEATGCRTMNDVVNHIYDDYERLNKEWRVCDTLNCSKNGILQPKDRDFVYHLLNENNIKLFQCNVKVNGIICGWKCMRQNKMVEHLNNKHYSGMNVIKFSPPEMMLNPNKNDSNYENCHSESIACPICEQKFSRWDTMIVHIKERVCLPNNNCPKCHKGCSGPHNLLIHLSKCYSFKGLKCTVMINGIPCRHRYVENRGLCKHLTSHYGKPF